MRVFVAVVAEQLRAAATLADPSSDAYEAAAQEAARVEDEEETARLRQESKREFLYSSNFKDKVLKKRALAAGVGEDDLKSAEDQEDPRDTIVRLIVANESDVADDDAWDSWIANHRGAACWYGNLGTSTRPFTIF